MRESSIRYLRLFNELMQSKKKLCIRMKNNGEAKTCVVGDNSFVKDCIRDVCGRTVRVDEIFFTILIMYQNEIVSRIPIPRVELTDIFRDCDWKILFPNITLVGFNPLSLRVKEDKRSWFYGTKEASIIDTSPIGRYQLSDFGRGIYLTDNSRFSKHIVESKGNRKLLAWQWVNDSLDKVIDKAFRFRVEYSIGTVVGKEDNRSYSILILPQISLKWADIIWHGLIDTNNSEEHYDMIYGPVCTNTKDVVAQFKTNGKRPHRRKTERLVRFNDMLETQMYGNNNNIVYQLCCFSEDVVDNFEKVK